MRKKNSVHIEGTLKDLSLPNGVRLSYDEARPAVTFPCLQAKRLAVVRGPGRRVGITPKKAP